MRLRNSNCSFSKIRYELNRHSDIIQNNTPILDRPSIYFEFSLRCLYVRMLLAIDQVDRVGYLTRIRGLSPEVRAAEMALLAGNPLDAEAILTNAGLSFRALILNIQLYNWDR